MLISYYKSTGLVFGCHDSQEELDVTLSISEDLTYFKANKAQYSAILHNNGCVVIDGDLYLPLGLSVAERLAEAKMLKAEEFEVGATKEIIGGFISSALGKEYEYPSKITDQANLTASITASLLEPENDEWTTPFWCKDPVSGEWAFRIHSKAQIQQVGKDCKNKILTIQAKKVGLDTELAAADTLIECAYLSWDELVEIPEDIDSSEPVQVIIKGGIDEVPEEIPSEPEYDPELDGGFIEPEVPEEIPEEVYEELPQAPADVAEPEPEPETPEYVPEEPTEEVETPIYDPADHIIPVYGEPDFDIGEPLPDDSTIERVPPAPEVV